jgi:hypothetical protein
LIRDKVFDVDGKETHQFGKAACYESALLPFPVTADQRDPRFYERNIVRDFPRGAGTIPLPETITMRVRILPVGIDVLDDLVASGDLDPAVKGAFEAMQVGPTLTWTAAAATPVREPSTGAFVECVTATNQDFRTNKYPPPVVNTCR